MGEQSQVIILYSFVTKCEQFLKLLLNVKILIKANTAAYISELLRTKLQKFSIKINKAL